MKKKEEDPGPLRGPTPWEQETLTTILAQFPGERSKALLARFEALVAEMAQAQDRDQASRAFLEIVAEMKRTEQWVSVRALIEQWRAAQAAQVSA
jgi:hypothetical protein